MTVPSLAFTFNHVLFFLKTLISNVKSKTECSCLAAIAAHSIVWVLYWRSLCCSNATDKDRNLDGRKGHCPSQLSAICHYSPQKSQIWDCCYLIHPQSSLHAGKNGRSRDTNLISSQELKCINTRTLPSWYPHFSQMLGSETKFLAVEFPNGLHHVNI